MSAAETRQMSSPNNDLSVLPKQRPVFPKQRSVWPKQRSVCPKQKSVCPKQKSVFPKQRSGFPKQKSVLPKQRSVCPKQRSALSQHVRGLNCGNITMFKSQKVGPAPNRRKWPEMGPEWSPGPENRSPGFSRPFSRLWDRSRGPKPPKYSPNSRSTAPRRPLC